MITENLFSDVLLINDIFEDSRGSFQRYIIEKHIITME